VDLSFSTTWQVRRNPDEFRGQRRNKHHPKNKSQHSLTRVRTLQSWLPKPTWQLWFDDEEHERDKDQYETSLKAALPTLVARAIATAKASMLHAVTSSTAAQAVAVLPSDVLKIPQSRRMRTSTGKAVMLMEIPINRAKARNEAPGCARWLTPG